MRFIFLDICAVAVKNIRNMHAVSTNQIADSLHFNDNNNNENNQRNKKNIKNKAKQVI